MIFMALISGWQSLDTIHRTALLNQRPELNVDKSNNKVIV